MIVQIENTNICNAKCYFCGHKYMKRPQVVMAQDIFEKIINECKGINNIEGVFLTGLGEPLLDPNIVDRVKLIKKTLRVPVTIYTNGTNIDKYLNDLLGAGLDLLYISLNACTKEKRKEIMGIDNFEQIDKLIRNWNHNKCKIFISSIPDWGLMEVGDCEKMFEMYGKFVDEVYYHYAANWAGKIFDLKFIPQNACPRPFSMIHVLNDGRVALCCLDIDGEVILGNNILEAINSEKLKFYRQKMIEGKRSELELCKNCTTV